MEVVKEIEEVPSTADKPNEDVVIVECGEISADSEGGEDKSTPASMAEGEGGAKKEASAPVEVGDSGYPAKDDAAADVESTAVEPAPEA